MEQLFSTPGSKTTIPMESASSSPAARHKRWLVGWPVNERIITARLYTRHAKVTIVQVYAPTEVVSEEEKDIFYTQLQGVLEEIPSYDIKLLIGDFNAKLDSDRRGLHTTVGPHWSASSTNDNGERLLMLTSTNGLSIGNTFFKHKQIHKITWVSPDDQVYAVDKLKNDVISKSYCEEVSKKLEVLQHPSSIEEQWGWFFRAISAVAVLGRRRGFNKERWISDRTWNLIDERKMAKIRREQKRGLWRWRMEDEEYRCLDKEVKKSCRNDRRRWLEEKAREAQEAAEKNEMKTLYRIVRELTSSRSSSGVPIRSKDGRALLSDEEQEARWVEHFREVLNQPTPPTLFNLDQEPPAPTLNITSDKISGIEVARAIKSLKNNKVPGLDKVSAELLKHGQEVGVESLTHLFNLIWHSEDVPVDWRSGVIVTLPKKGNLSDCNNWRGITLLSIPGKVFCSVLLQRLKTEVDNILREEQAGFRKGRSCSEQIFTLRNIIEQCLELQTTLIINYIDFKKAFDSVHRESLWQIVQLYSVPSKYVNIFKALYRNSTCRVRTSSGTTDDFDIVTGVRQGCILSPLLFLIVINFVMRKTLAGTNFREFQRHFLFCQRIEGHSLVVK
ncbi:hypothetical protein AAFF_G00223970 [Aldrovandia affinis]|uniref:Reverse transcriptase domain-containing protein n=1 Tax=Aldrovandia affinis TaxID=143900 RepID=A0AAD7X2Z4_9TELE|nr:hypothetical protein AAFF_G00223970 [Aldrovandia affinis]